MYTLTTIPRAPQPIYKDTRGSWSNPYDQIFDSLMKDLFPNYPFSENFLGKGTYPRVNVARGEKEILLEATVPGLTKDDVKVEINKDLLVISGDKNQDSELKDEDYVCREIKKSSFSRSFHLNSETMDVDAIKASVEHGLLKVVIPLLTPEAKKDSIRTVAID